MQIFLTGVSCCVGKTSIGKIIGKNLGIKFFDLNREIEKFFGTSIERLQERFFTMQSFRNEAAKALVNLLNHLDSKDFVIALPPSGMMGGYLRVLKKANGTTIVVTDKPENILERIRFYDKESRQINKKLRSLEKKLYLKEIKKDITYFQKSYQRADLQIDISGLDPDQAACKIIENAENLTEKSIYKAKPEQII